MTTDLTFDEYQEMARRTAIYPEVGECSPLSLAYVALGLSEAGEIQGKIKKILRQDEGSEVTEKQKSALIKEIGDTLWYLAQLASELGYGLGEVADANIKKLADRQERGVIKGNGDER